MREKLTNKKNQIKDLINEQKLMTKDASFRDNEVKNRIAFLES